MISKLDKAIISIISKDIPLVREPFGDIAHKLGIDQRELIGRIKAYKREGLLRKFSASLNHRKIGFQYNAMVVWNIARGQINNAARIMSSYARVSHCYQRKKAADWNYNLYTMIHGKKKEECLDIVRDISRKASCRDYRVLFSSKEYKKTPVKF